MIRSLPDFSMKYTSALLIAGLLTAGTAFAAEIDLSKLPPPADKQGVTYEKDIRPLLESSCFNCHSPLRPRPAGGLRLDTLELALKGGRDGKVIVPGDSAKSLLVIAVSQLDPKSAMPPPPRQRRGPGGPPPGNPPQNPPAATQPQSLAEGEQPAQPPPGGANPTPGGPQRGPQGPAPKPLTRDQVSLVRAWIDQGAK
jgi:Planctomycete cytochrome C